MTAHRRHDISDEKWKVIEPLLPGREGMWGGIAKDNRQFINAVFWIIRTGSPWRDLPPDYGKWTTTHSRFSRWCKKGVWEKVVNLLIKDPDYEWLMIDASHCKVHPHAAGAKAGNQDMGRTKGGLNTKLHLAVDSHGMPVRVCITSGTTADCTQAGYLIEGISADHLLADKAYDTDAIVEQARAQGMQVTIPSKKKP